MLEPHIIADGEDRGLSQRQLSTLAGGDPVQISRYERGQALPNAETLVSLAEALKIDTDVLLRGEGAPAARQHDAIDELDIPLLERFRDLQKLSTRDRNAVILLIDSVLARGDVEQRIKKRA